MPGFLINPSLQSSRVSTYANSGARNTAISSPYTGLITYLSGTNALEFYNGTEWVTINQNGIVLYASSAARSAALPSPTEGIVTYLLDENVVEYYDGISWNAVGSGGGLPTDFLLVGA